MIDPLERKTQNLLTKLDHVRKLTAISLFIEKLTKHTWRIASWAMLFMGLWLFQIPLIFGYEANIFVTIVFFAGLLFLAYTDLRTLRFPSKHEIDRSIEQKNNLKHRPLNGLDDHLANPKKHETRSLWTSNKDNLLNALTKLKTASPKAFMAKTDPYVLRFLALTFFALGIVVAGSESTHRLENGLLPIHIFDEDKLSDQILITITPPEYTKMAAINLKGSEENDVKPLSIPSNSTIKIRVHGGFGAPKLVIGDEQFPLEQAGKNNYILETKLPTGDNFKIKQFFITRASWSYKTIIDEPPRIAMNEEYVILPESSLRFPFTVYDDYSVETIAMTMELDGIVESPPLGEPLKETRSVFSPAATEFDIQPIFDLTYHPWAGLPVVISFEVQDFLGQTAEIPPIKMILPEREFAHPVSKSLIAMRKKLAWNPLSEYMTMGTELEQLLIRPDFFGHDPIVFLSIRSAASRLFWSRPSYKTAKDLLSQLWDTAIHVEDGNLQLSSRNLRDAQQALEDTLRDPDANEQDIREAMNDLREAMAEYFAELQKELHKRIESGKALPILPPEMMAQSIDPEELANFLDQLEQQIMNGESQSAQEMLSQLQRFMDMMDPSMSAQIPPDVQMMNDGINELQELIDRQKDLLTQTKKQAEIAGNFEGFEQDFSEATPIDESIFEQWGINDLPPPPSETREPPDTIEPAPPVIINTQNNKTEQEALRFILGQLMLDAAEALDEIPEQLGLAEQEMRGSSGYLGENNPKSSIPHQKKAIEYLEQSQEKLSQQLAQRIKQLTGMIAMGGGQRYDPLGRPYGGYGDQDGMFPGSRVKIPDEAERRRAQEILKLLRRRSSELGRPRDELRYFRRLLRQF